MPSNPPSPIPDGASTPETVPSRVTLPSPVIFSSRPELRSETSAAPDLRNAIPHGTSRSSAMTPAALGFGGPDSDGRVVGLGVVGLGVADCAGRRC